MDIGWERHFAEAGMRGDDALVLMGKAPLPGKVKTRMCPPLSPRRAAEFYDCLLTDVASEAALLRGVRRYLYFAPPEGRAHFLAASFPRYLLRRQAGNDLGERMARAVEEAFADGAHRAVVIGADCPALSAARIRSAFRELADAADAVFGPARDGGFYLAGLNAPAPSLFHGIEWSAPTVLSAVLSRCRQAGMTYALLPVESDVDTADDLAALRRWARTHPRPPCPRTRRWLRTVPR
jgi:rSAM/selenodomain-associated transferase 1